MKKLSIIIQLILVFLLFSMAEAGPFYYAQVFEYCTIASEDTNRGVEGVYQEEQDALCPVKVYGDDLNDFRINMHKRDPNLVVDGVIEILDFSLGRWVKLFRQDWFDSVVPTFIIIEGRSTLNGWDYNVTLNP
ncbi:MAG: hypothetical protein ACXAB7_23405 [Candidatus Kariarchaeaceae archaeon]|jgi:hypothetical protein